MLLVALLILETLSLQDAMVLIGGVIVAMVLARYTLFKEFFANSKQMMEVLKEQRDKAIKEADELREENHLLRREVNQRIVIWLQDQEAFKQLNKTHG